MQYAVIFKGCRNDNFSNEKKILFVIFARNIYCGYTLEPPPIYVLEQE